MKELEMYLSNQAKAFKKAYKDAAKLDIANYLDNKMELDVISERVSHKVYKEYKKNPYKWQISVLNDIESVS
jgi:hypothetical protein